MLDEDSIFPLVFAPARASSKIVGAGSSIVNMGKNINSTNKNAGSKPSDGAF